MRNDRLTATGLILLGAGLAASAILGPLVLGHIVFRVSPGAENQLIGGEIVSLVVAAPVAVAAGALWLRGSPLAPPLGIGPALYAVYTYLQFIVGPDYSRYPGNNEAFFPMYLALTILGWVLIVRTWTALVAMSPVQPSTFMRRELAAVLAILNVLFALAWLGSIAAVRGGGAGSEYQADPTLFWLVRTMDLAFVIPAALITAFGLLRGRAWATRLAYAVTAFQMLEVGAVAAMAAAMTVRGDPAASPPLLALTAVFALALGWLEVQLLRVAARGESGSPTRKQAGSGTAAESRVTDFAA
jgi:hypothetical protein